MNAWTENAFIPLKEEEIKIAIQEMMQHRLGLTPEQCPLAHVYLYREENDQFAATVRVKREWLLGVVDPAETVGQL